MSPARSSVLMVEWQCISNITNETNLARFSSKRIIIALYKGDRAMTLIETEETNQYTFEAFAAHGFYTEINRSLVRRALASIATRPNRSTLTIVDMACGTGAISRLVAEEIRHHGRQAHIIGVDPSAEALRRAQRGMEEAGLEGSGVHTDFIQGEADDLPKIVQHADAAFFCNAIDLLKQSGFDSVDARQECAIMTVDSYHDIGQYWLFIEGALPGVPLPVGAAALGISVYQAGQELGIKEIPRNWLQIVARKL